MNLPNKLSLLRICLIPFFVAAYFLPFWWGAIVAVGIFILAAFTDFLDGHIARKYNLVTDLGKLLDPIADKILVCAALFCLAATNPITTVYQPIDISTIKPYFDLFQTGGYVFFAVCGTLILSRELLISAVRMIAASKGVVVQANIYGKVKTVFQVVSLPCLLLLRCTSFEQCTGMLFFTILMYVGLVLFVVAVVLTIVSGIIYLVQNKKVFAEKTKEE